MPRAVHSEAFLAARDVLLAAGDDDRKPIGRLFGTMTEGQAALTPGAVKINLLDSS